MKIKNVTDEMRGQVYHFSAGGAGGCVYSRDVTFDVLERCWQHEEFQCQCPACGGQAFITRWAGNVLSGCFWKVETWCQDCGHEHYYCKGPVPFDRWRRLKAVADLY